MRHMDVAGDGHNIEPGSPALLLGIERGVAIAICEGCSYSNCWRKEGVDPDGRVHAGMDCTIQEALDPLECGTSEGRQSLGLHRAWCSWSIRRGCEAMPSCSCA